MGFLSYGAGKGLSIKHDFQKDIENLYQAEAYKAQIRTKKEQKARYYAGLMKEHPAVAPSMVRALDEFYKDLNNQVAEFAIENPNFETDVSKMQQFHGITDQYINNDFVRKDLQSQEQFDLLKAALNNGDIDPESEEYIENMERYTDWMENGGDGYVFTNPEQLDYNEMTIEANENIQPDVTIDDTGKRIVEVSETPYTRIVAYARNELKVPEKRRAIEKAYKLVKESGFYKNILDFRAREIAPGEEKKENHTGWNLAYKTMLDISKQRQDKIDMTYPYFVQDLAGLQPGSEIKGFDALKTLTEFGEKGRIDFGGQGREVFVDDPDNPGKVKAVKLMGQLVAVGTPVMKTMFGEAFVKVNVETIVDQNKEYEVEWTHTFKRKPDAEPQIFTHKEWLEFRNTLGLKPRQLEKLEKEGVYRVMSFSSSNTSTYGKMYDNAGFIGVKENIPGIMAGMEMQRTTESFPKYTGSIWMPAHLTPENMTSYEKARGGQAHATDIHAAESTRFENMMYEFSRTGNYTAAREMINDTMTTNKVVYMTAEGKKASKDNYSKKVSMGSWESTEEDPKVFVQKMTEEDSRSGRISTIEYYYDSMTGKYYYKNLEE